MKLLNIFKKRPKNAIFTIVAYRWAGGWAFTDESVGLQHEPFVAGADTMCEYMASGKDKVAITFSENYFPSFVLECTYIGGQANTGTTYHCPQLNHQLWLCPALSKYFKDSPSTIFVNYKPLD